ncbi:phosphinothricin acetyltransferase [Pseudoalteromonas sp. NBT06-2]|uniref:arsinothricin resistance N-acetyltransferase ArsN1 family B n=1 Tax=Pseudoalteromonas sp. NBT06-2 TaxID=2025950 RepID=UPI000BA741C1|nr:arsinothricin resistance N-acetyltransferase ArsN1 family B [Pseudoalteromonas sp. NBT06-2]PAJ72925.1 phosphinothricin acetyltransferase [Pseudoalteromonas sp. NBT06-2]
MIRPVQQNDIDAITHIYNHYILNTYITFETEQLSVEDMRVRIVNIQADNLPWLVARNENSTVVGYAYANKWNGRCAYKHSVEVTVYLEQNIKSEGWGTKLYTQLISKLKNKGIHSLIGGIALPNPASIALHEKFGMKQVAHFEEIGFKFDKWVDVGYWQCLINKT